MDSQQVNLVDSLRDNPRQHLAASPAGSQQERLAQSLQDNQADSLLLSLQDSLVYSPLEVPAVNLLVSLLRNLAHIQVQNHLRGLAQSLQFSLVDSRLNNLQDSPVLNHQASQV